MGTTNQSGASEYERRAIAEIEAWKHEGPGVVSRAIGFTLAPVIWLVRAIVPDSAIEGAVSASNWLALQLTGTADIARDGGVQEVAELRRKELALSDQLADAVHNRAIAMAAAEGGGAGFFGIFSAPVDVPALITLALRTIHKIGVCYGYECKAEPDQQFVLGILACSGANSVEEKMAALTVLSVVRNTIAKQTWKNIAASSAIKDTAIIGIRNLAKQLGVNLTKRKALAAIPGIGALVGASVNGWYIKDVGWAARRMFQERWLDDNGRLGALVPVHPADGPSMSSGATATPAMAN